MFAILFTVPFFGSKLHRMLRTTCIPKRVISGCVLVMQVCSFSPFPESYSFFFSIMPFFFSCLINKYTWTPLLPPSSILYPLLVASICLLQHELMKWFPGKCRFERRQAVLLWLPRGVYHFNRTGKHVALCWFPTLIAGFLEIPFNLLIMARVKNWGRKSGHWHMWSVAQRLRRYILKYLQAQILNFQVAVAYNMA